MDMREHKKFEAKRAAICCFLMAAIGLMICVIAAMAGTYKAIPILIVASAANVICGFVANEQRKGL